MTLLRRRVDPKELKAGAQRTVLNQYGPQAANSPYVCQRTSGVHPRNEILSSYAKEKHPATEESQGHSEKESRRRTNTSPRSPVETQSEKVSTGEHRGSGLQIDVCDTTTILSS